MPRPRPEVIDKAIRAMKRAAEYEYFFDRLTSPEWIEPLFEAGMFAEPTPPIPEGQFMRFPFWPQSRYLARMSPLMPETVLRVILAIPETDNVRVHEDFLDAALAMPPALASKIVPKAIRWLESRYQLLLPQKLGDLIGQLARGGEAGIALSLARVLFQPVAEGEVETITVEGETHELSREPKARFDLHYYEELLKKRVPDLVAAAGEDAVRLFADLLEEALRLSYRRSGNEGLEDYSHIWRPAVEDHEQNRPFTVRHFLVSAVRDSAQYTAMRDANSVGRLVETLEARQRPIFRRIALYLLRVFPGSVPTVVSARLTSRSEFDDVTVRHEYTLLLGERFAGLSQRDKEVILSWVAAGPDVEAFRTGAERWSGVRPTDTEIEQFAMRWRQERLAPIQQSLPDDWRARYEGWTRELGEAEHPEFPAYSTSWVGPNESEV